VARKRHHVDFLLFSVVSFSVSSKLHNAQQNAVHVGCDRSTDSGGRPARAQIFSTLHASCATSPSSGADGVATMVSAATFKQRFPADDQVCCLGYRLICLRAAILAAKVACCVDFSNNEDSPEAMAWQCLLLISARLDHVAPDQCSLDAETQQEEQTLCVLLTQLLFPALQESANKRKHKQYRGRAACSMLVSMFYCGAADCATIAGLLLKSGTPLSDEFSSCCRCQC